MKAHLKIHIKGLVQGIGFRYNAKIQAQKLKLKGTIENNTDGSVYIEIEGDISKLENFLKWCQKGSKYSRIDDVIIKKSFRLKKFIRFEIINSQYPQKR